MRCFSNWIKHANQKPGGRISSFAENSVKLNPTSGFLSLASAPDPCFVCGLRLLISGLWFLAFSFCSLPSALCSLVYPGRSLLIALIIASSWFFICLLAKIMAASGSLFVMASQMALCSLTSSRELLWSFI